MRSYFKELTVEEEAGGGIVSRTVLFPIYSVSQWFDDLGGFHQLIFYGSDLDWLSEMHVSVEN